MTREERRKLKEIMEVSSTFARVANIVDRLPRRMDDETPFRDIAPGIWPTLGEARRLRDVLVENGWRP